MSTGADKKVKKRSGSVFALGVKGWEWHNEDVASLYPIGRAMHYLIDGYNLLHAMGLLQGKVGPHGLEKARIALLGHLRGCHGPDAVAATVVFDASRAPPGATDHEDYQGIQVYYARHEEADDRIEELIRQESAPRQLWVISDDHRIQQAARRRQCPILGCLEFLDHLKEIRHQRQRPASEPPIKPEQSSPAETQYWLGKFADLADDPRLREFFESDLSDFAEEDEFP